MKKTLILLFFAIMRQYMRAQESQTVYNFLRLPVSSHAAALGGENVSLIEDDVTLMHRNPALLQNVSDRSVSLGYMNYMSGVSDYSASYAFLTGDKAVVGVSAQYLDYGTMKHTDAEGNVMGDFKASDFSLNATLSYALSARLAGGVTARFIYSSIGDYTVRRQLSTSDSIITMRKKISRLRWWRKILADSYQPIMKNTRKCLPTSKWD